MDWTLCAICQKETPEKLRCPLNGPKVADPSSAYASFLTKVTEFRELNRLPVPLLFGEDIGVDEFVKNSAQWHKSCHMEFSSSKLARAKERTKRQDDATTTDNVAEKRRCRRQSFDKTACIFCTMQGGHLHEFATLGTDNNVKSMARDLQETDLLTRLEGGDLIAKEAKYHLVCLVGLRNRHRSQSRHGSHDINIEEKKIQARAFIELITHIENAVEDGTFCFKFASLRQLYQARLADLGIRKEINKVRFKEQVLAHFPHAQAQSDGKNLILVFEEGMQQMLKQAFKCDYEGDALILAKAARIVREDMISSKASGFTFNASFPTECQQNSVPTTLKSLVCMLLRGADLKDQELTDSQACLTVSQTILFNCKKRPRTAKNETSSTKSRHSLEYEPPLPLYIGLNIHTQTRSKKLITQLCELGLSVSYDRVIYLENQLAQAVSEDMQTKGVVCPANLRKDLFTVAALDNLDHNPSSTTATGSFHGTGISIFQFPTKSNHGQAQDGISLPSTEVENPHRLPDRFTNVPAVAFQKKNVTVPKPPHDRQSVEGYLATASETENRWLKHGIQLLGKATLDKEDVLSWSAYHAALQNTSDDTEVALTQLLPLFYEKAATPAMIKHIEIAIWKTVGDYLDTLGLTNTLILAGVASSGTVNSFLKAAHLTRTRHAH